MTESTRRPMELPMWFTMLAFFLQYVVVVAFVFAAAILIGATVLSAFPWLSCVGAAC